MLSKQELLKQKIDENVEYLNSSTIKLDALFVCTKDGFIVRSLIKKNHDIKAERVAAIISSLLGISDAAGKEIANEKSKNIILEFESNILVVMNFVFQAEEFIIAALSNRKNNLGQAIFLTRSFTKELAAVWAWASGVAQIVMRIKSDRSARENRYFM